MPSIRTSYKKPAQLTKTEAQELFQRWMSGNGGLDGDELLQIDD